MYPEVVGKGARRLRALTPRSRTAALRAAEGETLKLLEQQRNPLKSSTWRTIAQLQPCAIESNGERKTGKPLANSRANIGDNEPELGFSRQIEQPRVQTDSGR